MTTYSAGAAQILNLLHDRPVAFHPALVPMLGGPDEALFVSQLLYWDGKGSAPARWIYKTQAEWKHEIGLSRHRLRRARRRLKELGVLEERLAGMPRRLYYRLDLSALAALAGAAAEAEPDHSEPVAAEPEVSGVKSAQLDRDTGPQLVGHTYDPLVVEDVDVKPAPACPAISETTAQITMADVANPGPRDLAQIWRRVCANVRPALVSGCFAAYVEPCLLCGLEERDGRIRAHIEVPSDYERKWLVHRMGTVLPRALREELGREVEVVYCLPGEAPSAAASAPDVAPPPRAARPRDNAAPPAAATPPHSAHPLDGARRSNVSCPPSPSRPRAPPAKSRRARRR
jgi:hypothetical protein